MRRRRTILLLIGSVLLLLIGPYIASRLFSRQRQVRIISRTAEVSLPAGPVTRLRILAFNIAHGRGPTDDNWEGTSKAKRARIEELALVIRQSGADIVVLNEVDFSSTWSGHQDQAEAIAIAAGYPFWVEQRNLDFRFLYGSWKFGNVLLSRFPISDAQVLGYPAFDSTERLLAGCKSGSICTIQLSESQQVRVLPVHLEHRSEEIRVGSAKMMVDAAQSSPIPLIAAGDFNSTPAFFPAFESSAGNENAMDVLVNSKLYAIRPTTVPTSKEMTFPSMSPNRVIDWIAIPAGWQFAAYRVLPCILSDHRPLVAEIELPPISTLGP